MFLCFTLCSDLDEKTYSTLIKEKQSLNNPSIAQTLLIYVASKLELQNFFQPKIIY